MKIAIYGSRRQEAYVEQIKKMLEAMSSRGMEVVMHRKLYTHLLHLDAHMLAAVTRVVDDGAFTADYAVSIGGDGTFLRTAMWVGDKEIPIVGINTGHLGYLAGADIDTAPRLAEMFETGAFDVMERTLICVEHPQIKGWPYALNEATIAKEESSSMIVAGTTIDGEDLASYKADGLIVATPTGSTAYNLSVGGPIVQPDVPVWVLSPIAAHSLSMRPLVVSDKSRLQITVDARAHTFRLSLDGRSQSLPVGTSIEVSRAPFVVRVVKMPGYSFPSTLRSKLLWGVG